ncbi:unnamed protein product [Tenebrio molitor]|nr:unnamed protein product [Tenebrio molitor]
MIPEVINFIIICQVIGAPKNAPPDISSSKVYIKDCFTNANLILVIICIVISCLASCMLYLWFKHIDEQNPS